MMCTKNLIYTGLGDSREKPGSLLMSECYFMLFGVYTGCCEHRNLDVAWDTEEVEGLICASRS